MAKPWTIDHARTIAPASRDEQLPWAMAYFVSEQHVLHALAEQYGRDCRIEDCWRPFAAVATNLSTHNLELIRTGPVWQAVRASSAIPGLLPPFYTPEGAMLVDGCLIDNVPLTSMHQLKSGPNLVVHFGEPAAEMFDVDYAALPGRFELIAAMLTRMGIESYPALVDTRTGHDLVNQPPRIGAFNHCISMAVLDGQTYWFEGTSSVAQGGDLGIPGRRVRAVAVQEHDGIAFPHLHVRHLTVEDFLPLLLVRKRR